jgi:hypothetical protein
MVMQLIAAYIPDSGAARWLWRVQFRGALLNLWTRQGPDSINPPNNDGDQGNRGREIAGELVIACATDDPPIVMPPCAGADLGKKRLIAAQARSPTEGNQ